MRTFQSFAEAGFMSSQNVMFEKYKPTHAILYARPNSRNEW